MRYDGSSLKRERNVKRNLSELARRNYDIVVVGGGAFGCCAAWDAASRGLSVALVEKSDFCQATSANHLKMVHGGIRYLQHLDIPRVRESLRERAALLRIAPHLVQPVPIVMPTYGSGMESRLVLGSGLKLYDLIAFDRNRAIQDRSRQIPAGRLLSRTEVLALYPDLDRKGLTGAGLFYDGQFYNPPRLALAFVRAAVDAGAEAANYVKVTGFCQSGTRITGVTAEDCMTGDKLEIRGRVVLNAAGPWAARLLEKAFDMRLGLSFSRDTGLVLKGLRTGHHALACPVGTSDPDALLSRHGRHVFLVPWRQHTLLGVWHEVHDGEPEDISVTDQEILAWLDDVNRAYPAFDLKLDDVSMVYAGLTLFGENRPGAKNLRFGKRSLLIDHQREHGLDGLITLVGVRATTARGMAKKAVDRVLKKLERSAPPSKTSETILPGGDIDDFSAFLAETIDRHAPDYAPETLQSLARNYGTTLTDLTELAEREPDLKATAGQSRTIKAQIAHAVRSEMALTLDDVVFRRTDLGTAGHPGNQALLDCADIMAGELDWNETRQRSELREVVAKFPHHTRNAAEHG